MTEARPALRRLLDTYGLRPDLVVHGGAHHGQEVDVYLACGFSQIVMVEANPAAFVGLEQTLEERRRAWPKARLWGVQRALWSQVDWLPFHLTQAETQSSLLPPADGIRAVATCRVQAAPLTAVLQELGVGCPTLLVLDLQGAELAALQGCREILSGLPLLITEVNYEARYQGCPLLDEVDDFLVSQGFCQLFRSGPFPGCPAGNAVYLSVAAARGGLW